MISMVQQNLNINEDARIKILPYKCPIELELKYKKYVTKSKNLLEEEHGEQQISTKEHMILYTMVFNMWTKGCPNELYDMYKGYFKGYFNFSELHGEFMLKELVKRFKSYKPMVHWLPRWFQYLDKYFLDRYSRMPTLKKVAIMPFYEIKDNVKDVVIALIECEHEGMQIDQALLKNVVNIFVEIRMGSMDAYKTNFERFLLQDTTAYYKKKASSWIEEDFFPIYVVKVRECLMKEKESIGHYLHASSIKKVLKVVEYELITCVLALPNLIYNLVRMLNN